MCTDRDRYSRICRKLTSHYYSLLLLRLVLSFQGKVFSNILVVGENKKEPDRVLYLTLIHEERNSIPRSRQIFGSQ